MTASDTIIQDETPRNQYTASSNQKKFAYTFLIFDESHLDVFQTTNPGTSSESTTELTLNTDYTVTGVGNQDGGNIELSTGASDGDRITIERDQPVDRLDDFLQSGDYLAEDINFALDTLYQILQERKLEIDRAATLAPESNISSISLPAASAGASIGWNANGDGLANVSNATYTEDVSLSGGTTKTITHNLNQKYVAVQFYDNSDLQATLDKIKPIDKNNVDIESSVSVDGTVVVSL